MDGEEKKKGRGRGARLRTPPPHAAPLLPRLHFTPSFLTLPPPNPRDGKWDVVWEVSSLSHGAPSSLRSSTTTCSTGLQQKACTIPTVISTCCRAVSSTVCTVVICSTMALYRFQGNKLLHCGLRGISAVVSRAPLALLLPCPGMFLALFLLCQTLFCPA